MHLSSAFNVVISLVQLVYLSSGRLIDNVRRLKVQPRIVLISLGPPSASNLLRARRPHRGMLS